jgi:CRISPR-associated endonuclease/helicase Cas3
MEADATRRSRLLGARPVTLFLRAPDLVDLFDTDATLDGDDPDVSRFIRIDQDLDVGVAWRDFPTDRGPSEHEPLPTLDEICPVPVWERRRLAELGPWRWSYARRRWERVTSEDDVLAGDLLLLSSDAGGYDTDLGWTGKSAGRVVPIAVATSAALGDTDADDRDSLHPGRWISLKDHTRDVLKELHDILARLGLDLEWAQALELAALAHDTGKAHREFQKRLRRWAGEDPPDNVIYAKAPDKVRWRPRFAFRHELVSALLLLERGGWNRDLDLAAYLVAAHHGKLRLTPRLLPDDQDPEKVVCLGVCEGDEVPEVIVDGERFGPLRVDLSLMRIGDLKETTWVERALDLRDKLGVFRLAYLEALLRAADQRASEKERRE